jgi:hypothetical protein
MGQAAPLDTPISTSYQQFVSFPVLQNEPLELASGGDFMEERCTV